MISSFTTVFCLYICVSYGVLLLPSLPHYEDVRFLVVSDDLSVVSVLSPYLVKKESRESSSVGMTVELETEGRWGLATLLFKNDKFGESNTMKQYGRDRV